MKISIVIQLQNTIIFFFIGHNYFVLRNTVLFNNVAVYYVVKKILFSFLQVYFFFLLLRIYLANSLRKFAPDFGKCKIASSK